MASQYQRLLTAHIIGLIDLVIHETDDGRIEIVPNNVHRFKQLYAHKGYVSKMLKLINGKEVADEDEQIVFSPNSIKNVGYNIFLSAAQDFCGADAYFCSVDSKLCRT